jgi:hypothetical protein
VRHPDSELTGIGTGVSVGGIFTWNIIGTLSVRYTLDGVSSTQDYTVTSSTQQYAAGEKQQSNFIWFQKNSLSSGQHTLEMQVINAVNQVFELDYITYIPSFNTVTSQPLPFFPTPNPSSPSTPSASTPSASPINNSTTNPSTTVSTTSASTHNASTISTSLLLGQSSGQTSTSTSAVVAGAPIIASTSKSTPVGTIVGAVVGGICLLLVLLLLLCRKRRRSNRRTSDPFQPMASLGTFLLSSDVDSF